MQLPNIGVQQQHITFSNVTMESERFIVVRETAPTNTVVIVDLASPLTPLKRPITADSALMNPNSKIIALKAANPGGAPGDNLQIFNLDAKAKLKSVQFPEQVVFWKWITGTKLGLVTGTALYHWDMEVCAHACRAWVAVQIQHHLHCAMRSHVRTMCLAPQQKPALYVTYWPRAGSLRNYIRCVQGASDPVKVFDRTANLEGTQIINYRVDPEEKWCVLIGIAPGAPERRARDPPCDRAAHPAALLLRIG